MKFEIIFIFLLFQVCLSIRTRKLDHVRKLPQYNFDFTKNRAQLAKLMVPKKQIIKRVMPDIQMSKNGYYNIDKYRKFLHQAYDKNRQNDVVQFKTANLYREHNLYHPSEQAIRRIAKRNAFKKMEKKKKFAKANAWRAFKNMGMRRSFLRHIPKKERMLKQLKKKQKHKMDIVLQKFQELFGSKSLHKKPRRLAEQQAQPQQQQQTKIDEKQKQTPEANQQKAAVAQEKIEQKKTQQVKKDIRQTAYLKRKVLLDEIRNQYHSIKRLQRDIKHTQLVQEATKKKYEFKGRKLLQALKRMKRERRLNQTYILTNFNLEFPEFDFDFLNGKKTILQYKKIQNLDYNMKKSVQNFRYYYSLFSECMEIIDDNFKWSELDDDPRTSHCRSRYAYLIMILRNVFLKTESMILRLLPKNIIYDDDKSIKRRDFFQGMVQQKYFSYEKSIDTLANKVNDLENITINYLSQKLYVQELLKVARATDNFYKMQVFAKNLNKPNLVEFLVYMNNECIFYEELQSLVRQYIAMKEGKMFLQEFQKTIQQQIQSRKLNNTEQIQKNDKQIKQPIEEIAKFLKANNKNYLKLIQNEQLIFKKSKDFISNKQKRQLNLLNTINDILTKELKPLEQSQNQKKLLSKIFQSNEIPQPQQIKKQTLENNQQQKLSEKDVLKIPNTNLKDKIQQEEQSIIKEDRIQNKNEQNTQNVQETPKTI